MASLYKKRGFYYIDFWVGDKRKTENTKLKATVRNYRAAFDIKTEIEREVELKKKEIKQRSYEISETKNNKDLTTRLNLLDLINKYKIKLSLRSESHQQIFDFAIKHFINIVPVDLKVTDITPEHIILFIKSIQHKVQNATLITYMNYLKGFFNYLVDEEYLTKSPIRKKDSPKRLRKGIITFSDKMLNDILEESIKKDYVFYCILKMLYLTGIRPIDMLNLKLSDIDFNNKVINVRISKTQKEIKFPLYDDLYYFIKDELTFIKDMKLDDLLFNGYSVARVGRKFRRLKEKLKITDKFMFTLKTYRKSFATKYAKKLDIQDVAYLLGHDKIETTRTYYANVIVDNVRTKMEK
ncbi:MAG TPA: site-specific integrase [Ignavibacteria bacterium]